MAKNSHFATLLLNFLKKMLKKWKKMVIIENVKKIHLQKVQKKENGGYHGENQCVDC